MISGWDIILVGMNPYSIFLKEGFRTRSGHLLQKLLSLKGRGRVYYAYPEGEGGMAVERMGNSFSLVNLSSCSLSHLIKKEGLNQVLFWLYHPLLWHTIPPQSGVLLFDAVDYWVDHPSFSSCRGEIAKAYQQIRKKAQIIFTVSQELARFFQRKEGNVYWIRNAVPQCFLNGSFSPPEEVKNLPLPIIGYVGVMEDRFDTVLIKRLARSLEQKTILLVGPMWRQQEKILKKEEGVLSLGFRPYHDIPRFISSFQVGLIPHKVNSLTQSMDPIKIYEYLALGCPVVSTPVAGSSAFSSILKIASSHKAFIHAVKMVLKNPGPPERRKEAVKRETWEERIKEMQKIFIHYLYGRSR